MLHHLNAFFAHDIITNTQVVRHCYRQTTLSPNILLLAADVFATTFRCKTHNINTRSKYITSLSAYFGTGYTNTVQGRAGFGKIMIIGLQKICSFYDCGSFKKVLLRSEFGCRIIRCYAVTVTSSECRVLIMQFPFTFSACFSSHDKIPVIIQSLKCYSNWHNTRCFAVGCKACCRRLKY
jgi:hypothetical protein